MDLKVHLKNTFIQEIHPEKKWKIQMTDNNDSNKPVSMADLNALLEAFNSKLEIAESKSQEREKAFRAELDLQANKIHSSYAKKMKKLGSQDEETEPDTEGTRRPTKRELELQDSIEKMIKKSEESERKARVANLRGTFAEQLVKSGVDPEAVDTIFTVMQAKGAFIDDGEDQPFKLKVNVDGVPVSLPLDSAIKHYVKSPEAKFYIKPIGAAGSGATPKQSVNKSTFTKNTAIEVDWAAAAKGLAHGFDGTKD